MFFFKEDVNIYEYLHFLVIIIDSKGIKSSPQATHIESGSLTTLERCNERISLEAGKI